MRMRDRKLLIHPLLFALFPILSLFTQNRNILLPSDLIYPIALALGCCAVAWGTLRLLGRSRWTAAAATSWLFLAFYGFPAVRDGLTLLYPFSAAVCLAVWLVVALAGCAAVLRSARDFRPINGILNVTASVAIAVPFALSMVSSQLDSSADGAPSSDAVPAARAVEWPAAEVTSGACCEAPRRGTAGRVEAPQTAQGADPGSNLGEPPDIYYIILDGYARQDILRRYYDRDNEQFLHALEERGFYVARRSHSNYCQTYLSLSSSLNSTYLDEVARRMGRHSGDRAPLREMIAHNRAAAFLRARGYSFVAFSSGYTGTEIPEADVYLEPPGAISEFGRLLRDSTPLPTLDEALGRGDLRYRAHRERIVFTLGELRRAAEGHRPAFVFAHVFAPHPPFVFGPNGEARGMDKEFSTWDGGPFEGDGEAEYVRGYRDQLQFLNSLVLTAVDGILASGRPAIIVLQGDHGPALHWEHANLARSDPRERFSILNAYYFPDRHYGRLYPEINPVNTFRIIFTQYFAAEEPLLEERSYASSWSQPYRFVDVTETVREVDGRSAAAPAMSASGRREAGAGAGEG